MTDLSVIIVNFNTKDKLQACLQSVSALKSRLDLEVWVVDNGSSDGSAAMVKTQFPEINLISNEKNYGFAKANNQAIRKSAGRHVLLLNSDVEVELETFDKMVTFMDNNPTVGISGCKVVKPDGLLDQASRRSFPDPASAFYRLTGLSRIFPNSQRFARYNLTYLPEDVITEVDSVVGAFLLIRREAVEKIGLLDEDYFMYGEDLDWCYRAKQAGYKVMYVPITQVVHDKGSSSKKIPVRMIYEFHRAMQIFYNKHYRNQYNFFVSGLVSLGIWSRYFFKLSQNFFRKEKFVSK